MQSLKQPSRRSTSSAAEELQPATGNAVAHTDATEANVKVPLCGTLQAADMEHEAPPGQVTPSLISSGMHCVGL